jgi:microcystin-dependent protein
VGNWQSKSHEDLGADNVLLRRASACSVRIPSGWLPASGQVLPIAEHGGLFALLGTTYGGNGTTTFALPNLDGRAVVGAGAGPGLTEWQLGDTTGAYKVTLTIAQLPAHTHELGSADFDQEPTWTAPTFWRGSGATGWPRAPRRARATPTSTAR